MEISIIIPTHDRKEVLLECLRLLEEQSAPEGSCEVIVVDDGSTDGTGELLPSCQLRWPFTFIRQEHGGQAQARNRGIEAARGRLLLFIDDDVLAHPGLVEAHLALQRDAGDLIVRGPVINIPRLELPARRPIGIWDRNNNYFCTSNVSVAKEQVVQAGMFDPAFLWMEDTELGFRLRARHLRWKFTFQGVVFHYKPFIDGELESVKSWAVKKAVYGAKLYRRHPHWRIRLALGIHWPGFLWGAAFHHRSLTAFCEKVFYRSRGDRRFYLRSLFTSQIAGYYYLKTLREELGKGGDTGM